MADDQVLTRDNSLLSRPKIEPSDAPRVADMDALGGSTQLASAGACTATLLQVEVEAYVQAGIASATKRAYRADLAHFRAWGATIPATEALVAAYLADHAALLKVSTLTRRLATVSIAHDARDLPNPVRSPLVRATMRGIRREHGAAQRQARPLLREDLFVVLAAMGDRPKDLRDKALLLIGFAGGLRRSELIAVTCNDLERVQQGVILAIRRSKTDQEGLGRKIGIPFGRTIHCPVRAVENWLSAAAIVNGPVFRPVDRHGRVSASRLSGEAVSLILRERMAAAGFDTTGYSGHSLRAGFATSANSGGGLDVQDQAADRACFGRHAFALRPGRRAVPRERRRHSSLGAGMACWALACGHQAEDLCRKWTPQYRRRSRSTGGRELRLWAESGPTGSHQGTPASRRIPGLLRQPCRPGGPPEAGIDPTLRRFFVLSRSPWRTFPASSFLPVRSAWSVQA